MLNLEKNSLISTRYKKNHWIHTHNHTYTHTHTRTRTHAHTHACTHVLVRARIHTHVHYQTIAKQTINIQITDSFSLLFFHPPAHSKKKKKIWNIHCLLDFLKPTTRICRSHVLINWHRLRRPKYKTIWYIMLLL